MPRKPKEKSEQNKPTIVRAVRLPGGDMYGPGEEEEFLVALADASTASKEAEEDIFDDQEEIKRLTKLGFLVNFPGADEEETDEEDDITHDQKADRAMLAEVHGRVKAPPAEPDEDAPAVREKGRNRANLEEAEVRETAKPAKRKGSKSDEGDGGSGG